MEQITTEEIVAGKFAEEVEDFVKVIEQNDLKEKKQSISGTQLIKMMKERTTKGTMKNENKESGNSVDKRTDEERKDFLNSLNRAKKIFHDEMEEKIESAIQELHRKIHLEGENIISMQVPVNLEFLKGSIEVQGDTKTFKFHRHELWYGRCKGHWRERMPREKQCVFNKLREELLKRTIYLYDITDPEKGMNIKIFIRLKPFKGRPVTLWHGMN